MCLTKKSFVARNTYRSFFFSISPMYQCSSCYSMAFPTTIGEPSHSIFDTCLGMERVAEHINEMQRIHEEYGAIFDHLQRQHLKATKTLIELSPVELLYYGGVDWVNISEFLGKIKKGLDLHAMCFVFKQAVVFLCKERIRQKKKLVVSMLIASLHSRCCLSKCNSSSSLLKIDALSCVMEISFSFQLIPFHSFNFLIINKSTLAKYRITSHIEKSRFEICFSYILEYA